MAIFRSYGFGAELVGIALTRVRYALKNAQPYQNYYSDSDPLLWHMRKVRAPRQTDNQHDETNNVQSNDMYPPLIGMSNWPASCNVLD
jgi:hypothetical protein